MTPTPTIRLTALWRDPPPTPDHPIADRPPTSRAAVDTPAPPAAKLSRSVFAAAAAVPPGMPAVGETYLGFRLVQELGRGSFARVFLAEQAALAGRQVALKVTLRPTREPERLARLQHPNIVPVYSVHPADPAQVICMPFRGRRTLSDLLSGTRPSAGGPVRRSWGTRKGGSTTILGGRAGSNGQPLSGNHHRPDPDGASPDGDSELVGNPDAVLRLLRQLADGLAHAHARGILHLDLKPANVLLADSGEPMLLDFNLSYDTTTGPDRDLVGGTIPYMAPEQIADLRSRGRGGVDARTDLYGLGVVAFELLTGTTPFAAATRSMRDYDGLIACRLAGPPRLRDKNPAVSPAVEAVVRKLLAPAPPDRYQAAAELADDIDRHLSDRPLRFAPNPSLLERAGKWRRRHPKAPARLAAAVLLTVAVGVGAVAYQKSEAHAEAVAVTRARNARITAGAVRLDLAVPTQPAHRKRGIDRAAALLAGYGLPEDPAWQHRDAVRRLAPGDRAALAADLGELLTLVAHAKWQAARPRPEDERKATADDGLRLVRAAAWCFPADQTPPFLTRLRAEFTAVTAGEQPAPVGAAPASARDHFLEAVGLIADGRYAGAVPHLKAAVAHRPEDGPAQYALALCLHKLGEFDTAAERYEVAQALLPDDPRPAFARGLILAFKKPEDAAAEFTRAIELDPADAEPYLHRGRVRGRLGRYAEAEADYTAALDRGGPGLQIRLLRADARRHLKDDAGAKADLAAAADCRPATELDYLVRAAQLVRKDPRAALEDYRSAAALNPRSLPALQNQAHVLAEKLGADEEALAVSAKAAAYYPEFAPARVGHAILLARLGRRDAAHREVEQALILSEDPAVIYQAGCVYALTAKTHPADTGRALDLLRKAFGRRYPHVYQLASDPDLKALRSTPEFKKLAESVLELFGEV